MEPQQEPPHKHQLEYGKSRKPLISRGEFCFLIVFAIAIFIAFEYVSHYYNPYLHDPVYQKMWARKDIANFISNVERFKTDCNHYPSSNEGLSALLVKPNNLVGWNGPYGKKISSDPWGRQYIYIFPGTHNVNGFDLFSTGPDGKIGTADDIGNW